MQVLQDKIAVKPFPPKEKTSSGLFIPDSAKERPSKATVVAVGRGTKGKEMYLKPGYIVYHIQGAGTQIEDKGETYFVMPERDVLAYDEN